MEKIRVSRGTALCILLIDSSSSMRLEKKANIAKGIVWKLLKHSYQKRNRVALIAFRGDEPTVMVNPIKCYRQIECSFEALPTGGKTPLTPALRAGLALALRERSFLPVLMCISDGRPNVFFNGSLERDCFTLARIMKGAKLIAINTDSRARSLGALEKICRQLGGQPWYRDDLS